MPLCAGCCAGEWRATEAAERNLQPAVEFTCGMPPYAHQGTPAPSTTRQVVDKSGQRYSVLRDSQTKGFWTYPTKFLGFCGTPGARLTDCRQMRRTAARAPHSCLRNRSGPHVDALGNLVLSATPQHLVVCQHPHRCAACVGEHGSCTDESDCCASFHCGLRSEWAESTGCF